MIDFKALAAPFPPDRISWRVGSTNKDKTKGMALAFIDARDVMERLDAVCGPDGWQNRYPHANGKTVCEIGVLVNHNAVDQQGTGAQPPLWVWKSDGAGDTDVEAEKGALSDAFKRAAVRWGIGRYLYDLASPWVALEAAGRSFKIADSEMPKLRALLAKDAKQSAPAPQQQTEPPPASTFTIPTPSASDEDWKVFAAKLLKSAKTMMTVAGLEQWQVDRMKELQAVKVKSTKLHDWLAGGMADHYRNLSAKEAA